MSGMAWLAQQIVQASDAQDSKPVRYNPRPPGVMQRGAAYTLLEYMRQQHPGRYFTSLDLIRATGNTHSAVSWGLYFLRTLHYVETAPDPRNARYLRYRLAAAPCV